MLAVSSNSSLGTEVQIDNGAYVLFQSGGVKARPEANEARV